MRITGWAEQWSYDIGEPKPTNRTRRRLKRLFAKVRRLRARFNELQRERALVRLATQQSKLPPPIIIKNLSAREAEAYLTELVRRNPSLAGLSQQAIMTKLDDEAQEKLIAHAKKVTYRRIGKDPFGDIGLLHDRHE